MRFLQGPSHSREFARYEMEKSPFLIASSVWFPKEKLNALSASDPASSASSKTMTREGGTIFPSILISSEATEN